MMIRQGVSRALSAKVGPLADLILVFAQVRAVLLLCMSSAKKVLRALSGVSGSRRNPLKSIFVVQTSQDGLGQNSMIARNPVSGESLHRAVFRRFWHPRPQAEVWAALVVMRHPLPENSPQVSLIQRNKEIQTLPADGSD